MLQDQVSEKDLITELTQCFTLFCRIGHHTKGPQEGKARLLPHIKAMCLDELGLKVREVKDSGGYSGALLVELRML